MSQITKVKTDWARLSSLIAKQDAPKLAKFKAHCDANVRKMAANPAKMPAIDWSFYKASTADRQMVDMIEKNFNALKVDYPAPPSESMQKLDSQQEIDMAKGADYIKATTEIIEAAEVTKDKFKKMIPFKHMSIEDWYLTFPEWSATHDRPSMWPHFGRWPGLTREEAAEQEKPDPLPYSTPAAHRYWDEIKNKWYN